MNKVLIFDGLWVVLYALFYTYTAITKNQFVINSRTSIYTVLYFIVGFVYPILYKYVAGKNIIFFKGFLKVIIFIAITQGIGFLVYLIKTGAIKYGDWMSSVFFLSFFAYSILIIVISFLIGYFSSRYFKG